MVIGRWDPLGQARYPSATSSEDTPQPKNPNRSCKCPLGQSPSLFVPTNRVRAVDKSSIVIKISERMITARTRLSLDSIIIDVREDWVYGSRCNWKKPGTSILCTYGRDAAAYRDRGLLFHSFTGRLAKVSWDLCRSRGLGKLILWKLMQWTGIFQISPASRSTGSH